MWDASGHPKVVYTPSDEPYLGRETLHAFDNLIIACMKSNSEIAPRSHEVTKSDLQLAACQIIPQGISISLSIRELIRQGYLFGALVLLRPLVERAITILYLSSHQDKLAVWNRGWKHNERPKLSAMLNAIGGTAFPNVGPEVTRSLNSLTHGDPDSALWNLVQIGPQAMGHAVGKMLESPKLCDKVCLEAAAWLSVILSLMHKLFPETTEAA